MPIRVSTPQAPGYAEAEATGTQGAYNAARYNPTARFQTNVQAEQGFVPTQASTYQPTNDQLIGPPGVTYGEAQGVSSNASTQTPQATGNYQVPQVPNMSGGTYGGAGATGSWDAGGYQNPTVPGGASLQTGEGSDFAGIIPSNAITPFNFQQQRGENIGFIDDFTNFIQGQETLPAIQQRYENRYGIPDLQENYLRQKETQDMLGNQIRGLESNVGARTSGSMITQAQADRMVSKEAKGLIEQFNQLGQITESTGNRLAMAESNLNNAAKLEMAQMQKETTPWLMKYDLMNIMQAREFSGWGTVQQLELNRLMANQNWTSGEADRANALAMQANQFAHNLDYLEKSNEFALDLWA